MSKKAKASKAKTAAKAIQYWQNKNDTHEVDYEAVREYIKKEKILEIRPITEDEQIDALLRQVVRTATWKTPRGKRVRVYGVPRMIVGGEVIALPPVDMRYAEVPTAKLIFDANYEGGVSSLKRVAIELDEFNDYTLFKTILPDGSESQSTLPDYEWNLTELVQAARVARYDDSFNESDLEDDDEDQD